MSYCRFGDGSDVYVIHHVGGFLQCCGCTRSPKIFQVGIGTWMGPYRDIFKQLMSRKGYAPFKNRIRPKKKLGQREIKKLRKGRWKELRDNPLGKQLILDGAKRDGKRVKRIAYFTTTSTNTQTRSAMIAHLEHHRRLGDNVPQYAIDRLKKEIKEKGDKVK